jgi:hypothetical protein
MLSVCLTIASFSTLSVIERHFRHLDVGQKRFHSPRTDKDITGRTGNTANTGNQT